MKPKVFSKRAHRLAQLSICVLFLALVRTLAEFFRLQYIQGAGLHVATVAPYIGSALFTAFATWAGVLLYFAGRDRTAVGVTVGTILVLLTIKVAVIGF